jgi:hypothetical protein
VAHLEEFNRDRPPTRPRDGRTDLFTLLFDDAAGDNHVANKSQVGGDANNEEDEEGDDEDDELERESEAPIRLSLAMPRRLGSLLQAPRSRLRDSSSNLFGTSGLSRLSFVSMRASEVGVAPGINDDVASQETKALTRGKSQARGKSSARGTSVARRGQSTARSQSTARNGNSALNKDALRAVVKRYAQPGDASKVWADRGGQAVDDIVSGRTKGRRALWTLEVHVIEATSLPLQQSVKCKVLVGGEVGHASTTTATRGQGGRVLWNNHLTFEKIYNLYGTDLTLKLSYKGLNLGSTAAVEDSFTVPLACLDPDSALDDWYLLSNSDGMVRLRLVLKSNTQQQTNS